MDSKGKKDESLALHASDAEPNGGSCESELRYRQLVEMMNEGLARADGNYVFSYVNQRFADMLGYAPEEMIGHSLLDFVHSDDKKVMAEQIGRRKKGEAERYELAWRSKDGRKVYTLVSPRAVFDDKGNFAGSVAVLTDITDRRLAEQALHERLELEALIMSIATQFINLPSDQIDAGIISALKTVGEFTKVDRAYVFQLSPDGESADNTHEWSAEGVTPQIQRLKGLTDSDFPWFAKKIRKLETVYVPLVSDLPDEAAAEKKEWEIEGVQSAICVPMVYQGSLVGFVGFDAVKLRKCWPDDAIALLKMVAIILVHALHRKRTEEALKESEERYRSLVELSPDMVTVTTDGKIAYANPAAAKLVGAEKPEDLVGRSPLDLVHPRDRDKVRERMRLMVEEGKTVPTIVEQFLRMDGTYIDVEVAAMPVVYKGKPSILAVMRDITERKRAEEEREAITEVSQAFLSSDSLASLYDSIPRILASLLQFPIVAVELYDPAEQVMVFMGAAGQEISELGAMRVPVEQTISGTVARTGKPVVEMHALARPEYQFESLRRLNVETFVCVPMKIGERVLGTIALADPEVRLVSPTLVDTLQVVANYTAQAIERKQGEEALRRSEANFRAIFDYMPAAIFGYDKDGVIVQANEECERLFGFSRQELIGRSLFETISTPKDHEKRRIVIGRVFSGETVEGLEWEDRRADGSIIYVLSNTTPVFDKSGQIIMALSLSIDITERKLAEQRRRELETHKRDFYRRTIQAATEGKLLISEKVDIERIAGPAIGTWGIGRGEDLGAIRQAVTELAEKAGMDSDRVYDFVLTVGESTTNAYKHAGGGTASLHNIPDGFLFMVSDKGPGIEALTLPEVALVRGYSTAGSLGMGYKAILAIADKVYLATGPTGTTVAIAMRLHPAEKPLAAALLPDTWTS